MLALNERLIYYSSKIDCLNPGQRLVCFIFLTIRISILLAVSLKTKGNIA